MKAFIIFLILFLFRERWKSGAGARGRLKDEREQRCYDSYRELVMTVREKQHDMDNHISAILGMIYTIDNYDDLVRSQSQYCQEVMGKGDEARLLLSVKNQPVAGFLYMKLKEAEALGIRVDYQAAVSERGMKIPEYDLVEILGILFDNAVDALAAGKGERRIFLELFEERERIRILVANAGRAYSTEEIEGFFRRDYTTKGKGHGTGLKKLKKIVRRLEGDLIPSNEMIQGMNCLQFEIILPKGREP